MKKASDIESHRSSLELSNDFQKLFSESDNSKFPSFRKLFWQEKYMNSSSSTAICFHSLIIKFSLNLAAKSSCAYKCLCYDSTTGSGLLVLSSLRTLRHDKNYINSRRDFKPDVINGNKTASFSEIERYVTIPLNEIKIQKDLVWGKYSGELIEFLDLGDIYAKSTKC